MNIGERRYLCRRFHGGCAGFDLQRGVVGERWSVVRDGSGCGVVRGEDGLGLIAASSRT
jgi:hypothetical protein